jgi:hypothetical protein
MVSSDPFLPSPHFFTRKSPESILSIQNNSNPKKKKLTENLTCLKIKATPTGEKR